VKIQRGNQKSCTEGQRANEKGQKDQQSNTKDYTKNLRMSNTIKTVNIVKKTMPMTILSLYILFGQRTYYKSRLF